MAPTLRHKYSLKYAGNSPEDSISRIHSLRRPAIWVDNLSDTFLISWRVGAKMLIDLMPSSAPRIIGKHGGISDSAVARRLGHKCCKLPVVFRRWHVSCIFSHVKTVGACCRVRKIQRQGNQSCLLLRPQIAEKAVEGQQNESSKRQKAMMSNRRRLWFYGKCWWKSNGCGCGYGYLEMNGNVKKTQSVVQNLQEFDHHGECSFGDSGKKRLNLKLPWKECYISRIRSLKRQFTPFLYASFAT